MTKLFLNPYKVFLLLGLLFVVGACDDDDPVIDPGTGTVNVANGLYIAKDGSLPVSSAQLKDETVEQSGFKSQSRAGFVANHIFLEAGNYRIYKVVDKNITDTIGGTAEKKTDAGSSCNFNEYTLVKTAKNGASFNVAVSGLYKVTHDNLTSEMVIYKIEFPGLIGDATPGGWNDDTKLTGAAATKDGGSWQVKDVILRAGNWKIRFNCRWNLDRRIDPNAGFEVTNGYQLFTNYGGTSASDLRIGNDVEGNIKLDKANEGIYTVDITWTPKDGFKCKLTRTGDAPVITFDPNNYKFGVIGDATADMWNSDQDMLYVKKGQVHTWHAVVIMNATGTFKFRTNDKWDFDLGGSITNPTKGGANLASLGNGAYYLALSTEDDGATWKLTTSDFGFSVIGEGSPKGNWNDDELFTSFKVDNKISSFELVGSFTTKPWKIRAGKAWDLNLGGSLATLILGGDNITLGADGNYRITLNFDGSNYSATAQKL